MLIHYAVGTAVLKHFDLENAKKSIGYVNNNNNKKNYTYVYIHNQMTCYSYDQSISHAHCKLDLPGLI